MSVLLARLALSPGRTVSVDTLIDDLWGSAPPEGGADTLRRLASRARTRLGEHGLRIGPHARRGGYLLDLPAEEVDALHFEHLVADGARLLRAHAPDQAEGLLDEALALWRGTPLSGVEAEFARREAPRLEELRTAAAEDRADAVSRTGDPAGTIPELRALCSAHPTRERSHGLLMRVLHESGQSSAALTVHEDLRRTLAEELGADPAPWIGELHGQILRDHAPAQTSEWANPYLTRFFGRTEELAAIGALMERTRLVTLLGPGGVGKTRLAAEYTARAAEHLRVRFAELGPLREDDSLTGAVSAMLGTGEAFLAAPGHDRFTRLVSALSAVPTLLVLDNCEHLADEAAALAVGLLARCPDLQILITSREPLATDGEALLRVEPLHVPEEDGGEAVAMFTELASLARPGFTVGAENAPVVIEICRRLDGLPLGIELAAARTRSMTVQQIADHLDERFRLLSGTRRAATARHRTLRAVLDWTWDLLTDQERLMARRLSVLPGGATVDAARAVCAAESVPGDEVPYLLSSLTDKSLLSATEPRPGEPRYRLLETARVYLAERLREAGEETRTRNAAADHAADLAEDAAEMLLGRDQPRGLEILDSEHDNLLESLRHACGDGEPDRAVRITAASSWYWIIRGRYEEAGRWYDELDRHQGVHGPTTRMLADAVRSILPRPETAGPSEAGTRTGPAIPDAAALAAHPPLAMITPKHRLLQDDHEGVRADAETALAHPHPWVRAAGRATSALAIEAAGDAAGAERDIQVAAEAFWDLGDAWTSAQLIAASAGFRSARGDAGGAVADLRRALELKRSLGASEHFTLILVRLGDELARAGNTTEAEETFREVLDTTEAPTAEHRILCLVGLADLALLREQPGAARELLTRARNLMSGPLADPDYLRVVLLRQEGMLALAERETERAREKALRAWESARLLGVPDVRAQTAELVAGALWQAQEPAGAARALGTATRLRGRRDHGNPRVRSLVRELAGKMGEEGFARAYAEGASGAVPLFK